MATITKTYTENAQASYRATWTVSITGTNQTVSTSRFDVVVPTVSAKYVYAGKTQGNVQAYFKFYRTGYNYFYADASYYKPDMSATLVNMTSGTTYNIPVSTTSGLTGQYTSSYFNYDNRTSRTVNIIAEINSVYLTSGGSSSNYNYFYDYSAVNWGTIATITLDAPPTFSETFSYTGDFSGVPYAGLTTANVTLSSLSAKYGGSVTSADFTIGSQTVSLSNPVNDDVLSIPLNAVGTFTPTVKVTDSRGQVTTHTLNAITVQGYVTPSVNFSVERTLSTGVPDDEGESATVTATFNFTDAIATLSAPTIAVTDDDGITQTVSTTWYSTRASDGTLSGSVNWTSLSSGDTVYGLVSITGDFNTQKSYQIAVTPQDSEGTGTTVTQTLGGAYYTVDFYAGGHGIAFGQPASQDGFFCNMDAHFVDKADVMRALFDFIHPIGSYYETSDTTFNPNTTWGGTWVLETEGQVHISAGANYTVNGALTDTTDGGEVSVVLDTTMIPAHTHGSKTLTGSFIAYAWADGSSSGIVTKSTQAKNAKMSSGSDIGHINYNITATHEHTSVGGGKAHNNMQPYIIVNRWHRTA